MYNPLVSKCMVSNKYPIVGCIKNEFPLTPSVHIFYHDVIIHEKVFTSISMKFLSQESIYSGVPL